jgi:biofilm PGA synthesis N-glycosyltransferase PgaC
MTIEEISKYVFFGCLGVLFYTYIGYGFLAVVIGALRKKPLFDHSAVFNINVSVIIPAFNEAGVIDEKIKNTQLALSKFKHFQIILITDGSNDGSESLNFSDPHIQHLHLAQRRGKSAAINRAMEKASGEIIVITDANAMVNEEAIAKLVVRFQNKRTGAVSGEKKVMMEDGSTGGEGFYWKYESYLKKHSAKMYSLTGAAGELLAFRKDLFKPIPADAILDDMELSLSIIKQGKVIDYEPGAFAIEPPSKSIDDEFKRKVRISAGVFQTLKRNPFVFNPFKYSVFIFQFNSHRILRWTKGIDCIILLLISNFFIIGDTSADPAYIFFNVFLILQLIFYFFVILGFLLRNSKKIPGLFFLPFYFIMMNTAIIVGFFRYLGKKESVLWKKAAR